MRPREPSQINQLVQHRPPCSKCGAPTTLARIEPGNDSEHDERTFDCKECGHEDVVTVKFK